MNHQLCGVSDEHANCKRKSTGKKRKRKARACDRDCQNSNKNWTIDALTRNTK